MATQLSQFQFKPATVLKDGVTPIPAADVVSYVIYCDTVNPPLKGYPVPPANVKAAVAGLVTVPFSDIGFSPAPGAYFADVTATDGSLTSDPTGILSFTFVEAPAAPSGFTVS